MVRRGSDRTGFLTALYRALARVAGRPGTV